MEGTILTDAVLINANFANADLRYAELIGSYLKRVNFTNTNLTDAKLEDAYLEQANLTLANLFGADLTSAKLYGVVFDGTQVSRATVFGDHYDEVREDEPPADDDGHASAWDKARWTYRQLEQLTQDNALPERAREHFITRKEIRREEYRELGDRSRWLNFQWLKATGSRYIMRYGEGPKNVVYTSLALIGLFGVAYPLVGGIDETPTGDGRPLTRSAGFRFQTSLVHFPT